MPHPHMVFDLEECEQLSSLNKKTNFIITTCQADINFLMWSIFSIILRSKVGGFLEHINVVINGPDSRTGDPSLQDKKQCFLEDIRKLNWRNNLSSETKSFPLTVIRVWSRIGAEQSLEMAIPWVHTDSYIYMHDDAIWLNKDWEDSLVYELYEDKVAILCSPDFKMNPLSCKPWNGKQKLNFPHTHSSCMAVRKPVLARLGVKWSGYHFESDFTIEEKVKSLEDFFIAHAPRVLPLPSSQSYQCASYDIGAWAYYILHSEGYKVSISKNMNIYHFGSMSWFVHRPKNKQEFISRLNRAKTHIEKLEQEIKSIPEYWEIYNKYKTVE
jgi:hypothetical protein